jgi:hypothetical protein
MAEHPDVVRAPETQAPSSDEAWTRRKRHVLFAGLGALIGLGAGLIVLLVVSQRRWSGEWDDAAAFVFGLPSLLFVAGGVVGFLLGSAPEAEDVDAPIRDRRQMADGTAATSIHGQLPGSPVEPAVAPPPEGRRESGRSV